MVSVPRLILLVIILWVLLLILYTAPFNRSPANGDDGVQTPIDGQEMILARLSRASSELKWLKKQNEELRALLDHLIPLKGSPMGRNPLPNVAGGQSSCDPSIEFETTRRRLTYDMNELWFYLRTKVNSSMSGFINEHRHNMLHNLGKSVIAFRLYLFCYLSMFASTNLACSSCSVIIIIPSIRRCHSK